MYHSIPTAWCAATRVLVPSGRKACRGRSMQCSSVRAARNGEHAHLSARTHNRRTKGIHTQRNPVLDQRYHKSSGTTGVQTHAFCFSRGAQSSTHMHLRVCARAHLAVAVRGVEVQDGAVLKHRAHPAVLKGREGALPGHNRVL